MIDEIFSSTYSKIIFGIILIVMGLAMFYYTYTGVKRTKKDDYIRTSFHIRKYISAIIFLIIGFVVLIREILKIL
jgi:putative Mn2+ efflux pump MntP